jgi:ribonuclease T
MGQPDQSKPEIFFMVDVETSGPVPSDYSMLSIGAVVVGQHRPPFHKSFYAELKPLEGAKVMPEAMAVNKLNIDILTLSGQWPQQVMKDFREWVLKIAPPDVVRAVMVSMGTFDYMFVHWYFWHFDVRSPFTVNTLDMKSAYFGRERCRWSQTTSSSMRAKHPDWVSDFKHTHNALDDAIEQAERFKRMLGS